MDSNFVDDDLEYATIIPSRLEWARTFNDSKIKYYSVFHIWIRCVNNGVRGYWFAEDVDNKALGLSANQDGLESLLVKRPWNKHPVYAPGNFNYFPMFANGYLISENYFGPGGGNFFFKLNDKSRFLKLSIDNWLHYASFDMKKCEIRTRSKSILHGIHRPGNFQYVMHVFTWQEAIQSTDQINDIVTAITRHVRYHKCVMGIVFYEVVIQDAFIDIYLNNSHIVEAIQNGYLKLLMKGNRPGMLYSKNCYWQAVIENLSILRHWKRDPVKLMFWDPDEYLLIENGQFSSLMEFLNTKRTHLVFQRISTFGQGNMSVPDMKKMKFNELQQPVIKTGLAPKLAVIPDCMGPVFVHYYYAEYSQSKTSHVPTSIAYLAHFENFLYARTNVPSVKLDTNTTIQNQLLSSCGAVSLMNDTLYGPYLVWTTTYSDNNKYRLDSLYTRVLFFVCFLSLISFLIFRTRIYMNGLLTWKSNHNRNK